MIRKLDKTEYALATSLALEVYIHNVERKTSMKKV